MVIAVLVGQGEDAAGSMRDLRRATEVSRRLYSAGFSAKELVSVDILPGVCPNSHSLLKPLELDLVRPAAASYPPMVSVAIYGTEDLPATDIDPNELTLAEVSPATSAWMDVGGPADNEMPCGCGYPHTDRRNDRVLWFDRDQLLTALDPVVDGAMRTLELFAVTKSGRRLIGKDCLAFTDVPTSDSGSIRPPLDGDGSSNGVTLTNLPNPFNAATTISYSLEFSGPVRLDIFDILGRHVTTLTRSWHSAGQYDMIWTGRDDNGEVLGSGMYFYRLATDSGVVIRKMVLLK